MSSLKFIEPLTASNFHVVGGCIFLNKELALITTEPLNSILLIISIIIPSLNE